MSTSRRLTVEQLRQWSKQPGSILKNVRKNNTISFSEADMPDLQNIEFILKNEGIEYKVYGGDRFALIVIKTSLKALGFEIANKETREAVIDTFIFGYRELLRQYLAGENFFNQKGDFQNNMCYLFNTDYMTRLKEYLQEYDTALLSKFVEQFEEIVFESNSK